MQILRTIPRLLRSSNASPARMHRLSSPSRSLLSFMASTLPRQWSPGLAARVFPLMAHPNQPVRSVSCFFHGHQGMATNSRGKDDESGKPYTQSLISSAKVSNIFQDNKHSVITQGMKSIETTGTISQVIVANDRGDGDSYKTTSDVIHGKCDPCGKIVENTGCKEDEYSGPDAVNNVLVKSRHRDGSIYRDMDKWWKKIYRIADRNETRLEAMAFSNPTSGLIHDGSCIEHTPRCMLQIFSVELNKILAKGGLIELYGYIAVRDELDPLLNYVVNFSRDEPIIVEQGSLINMVGPKRGIEISDLTLIEYDMRIKTGKREKDDLQLIDGASLVGPNGTWNRPFTMHIPGDCGEVNIKLACLGPAVEATIEILISKVQSGFNLSLSCCTSGLNEEIFLFDGAITESRCLKRAVVAVVINSLIVLKFKVGELPSSSDQHCCSFKAKTHGHGTKQIKTNVALISVKVTWSTLPSGLD